MRRNTQSPRQRRSTRLEARISLPIAQRWAWLRVDRLLGEYRIPQDSAVGRRRRDETELAARAKGDVSKVKLAARLRQETLVAVKWIAERLRMGSAGYVNNRLYCWRQGTLTGKPRVNETKNGLVFDGMMTMQIQLQRHGDGGCRCRTTRQARRTMPTTPPRRASCRR